MARWDGGSVLRKEDMIRMVALLTYMLRMEDLLQKATVQGLIRHFLNVQVLFESYLHMRARWISKLLL